MMFAVFILMLAFIQVSHQITCAQGLNDDVELSSCRLGYPTMCTKWIEHEKQKNGTIADKITYGCDDYMHCAVADLKEGKCKEIEIPDMNISGTVIPAHNETLCCCAGCDLSKSGKKIKGQ